MHNKLKYLNEIVDGHTCKSCNIYFKLKTNKIFGENMEEPNKK